MVKYFGSKIAGDRVHEYSCVMALLPDDLATKVRAVGQLIPDGELYEDPEDPSFGRDEIPHITIRWGLHTKDPRIVRGIFADEGPIQAQVQGISAFTSSEKYDVLKLDIESPDLHRLHHMIGELTTVSTTHPDYLPHCTIAYLRKGYLEKYLLHGIELSPIPCTMNYIWFSGHDGTDTYFALNE